MISRACSSLEEILNVGFWFTDQSQAAVVQRTGSGLKRHLSHAYMESSLQNKVKKELNEEPLAS